MLLNILAVVFAAGIVTVVSAVALAAAGPDVKTHLVLLHTNDIHGHVDGWQGWEDELTGRRIGGMDRVATAVAQVRAEVGRENVLLLDAGDAIGDTLIADLTQGRAILDVMNAIGYDAMTIGNHEPDFTAQVLRGYIHDARFPVVAANIKDNSTRALIAKPYVIKSAAGVRVGILGLAYPNTPLTTARKNVANLVFEPDSAQVVREYLPRLRKEGAQVVVVLSHLGLGADKRLAEAVEGIDVIVSGHSHNRMSQAMKVGRTWIVQAGAHASDVGRLDLTIQNGKIAEVNRQLILLDHERIASDPAVARLIRQIETPHRKQLDEVLGEAAAPIVRAQTLAGQQPRKRDQQSPADSLFADILRQQTHSDVAFLPGIGYGVAIPAGPITAAELRNLIPHQSKVVTLTLSGRQIRSILEQAVENTYSDDPRTKVGGMIQVSGLHFVYDPEAAPSARVLQVSVGNQPLDEERRYRIATNSMLADGGHNYRTFLDGQDRRETHGQYEMIAAWIRQQEKVQVPKDVRIERKGS